MGPRVLTDVGARSAREFYDELAADYHLIYADWRKDVIRQSAVLDRLIRSTLGPGPLSVLDCACGIGTQAIGLAQRGYRVSATDVSAGSVRRAAAEGEAFGVDIRFDVADMRDLPARALGRFDVVIACDNPLAHLLNDDDLGAAVSAAFASVEPGGLFLTSLADHDDAIRARSRAGRPEVFDGPEGTRIVINLLEWAEDGRTYDLTLFILRREGDGWATRHHRTTERALRRRELAGALEAAGFESVRWHTPDETGFFQPIVTARRPGGDHASSGGAVLY